MSRTKPTQALQNAKYSFDASRNAWFCGKKPIEEEVLVHLIRYAKSVGITSAGEWAESELYKMKKEPALTARAWCKERLVRNRNNRIAGKYLFAEWCRSVGIEITGKIEDFMIRNSLLVARFYNEIAALFGTCKRQARVLGKVCNSVFFGIDIRVFADFVIPVKTWQTPENNGLRRYNEFLTKFFVHKGAKVASKPVYGGCLFVTS